MQHPDIIDARLTNYANLTGSESAAALKRLLESLFGSPAEELPFEKFVSYKYLVSMDGAGAAWKRVPTILASGSVLLLQHRWNQFFYPGMKPWKHYVPLENGMSDLVACIAHDCGQRMVLLRRRLPKALFQPLQASSPSEGFAVWT